MLRYLLSKNEIINDPLIETLISGYFLLVVCGEKMKKKSIEPNKTSAKNYESIHPFIRLFPFCQSVAI